MAGTIHRLSVSRPKAILIRALRGRVVEGEEISQSRSQEVWRDAGAALRSLHDFAGGEFFGPCGRDGSPTAECRQEAVRYISERFGGQIRQASEGGYIDEREREIVLAALELVPAFEGEIPVPSHRDYCEANWLIDKDDRWVGVVDFEFSYWDVGATDFSRDPDWSWIRRPGHVEAFLDGYGRQVSSRLEQQLISARAEYALSAIVWGRDNSFHGFEREGREALAHLRRML